VDNITATAVSTRLGWIPFVRDGSFGLVLFHEIGHHVHATVAPEYLEKEDVADAWAKRLWKKFARQKYWFLVPVAPLLRAWVKVIRQ
jgi:hypothetical protein